METTTCCNLNLKDGHCPLPFAFVHQLADGTTIIVVGHPCAKASVLLPRLSMSEAKGVTLSLQEVALEADGTTLWMTWPSPSRPSGLSNAAAPPASDPNQLPLFP